MCAREFESSEATDKCLVTCELTVLFAPPMLARLTTQIYGGSKGFVTTYVRVRTIKQKNFMLLVTETNDGLAYDRDTFRTSYLLPW